MSMVQAEAQATALKAEVRAAKQAEAKAVKEAADAEAAKVVMYTSCKTTQALFSLLQPFVRNCSYSYVSSIAVLSG